MALNLFFGIPAGRITSYRILNRNRLVLGEYGDKDFSGECFETCNTGT